MIEAYVAIRRAEDTDENTHDGHEWHDLETMSRDLNTSKEKAAQVGKLCGKLWAKANPVVRFAPVQITELNEVGDTWAIQHGAT